ncbi:MAG: L,D-transpeptidase [Clostridiales Family XIII bacterium]|jgi:hypothetical protein|nr:L,D-transpeptidase [Clostridiales Family XIII bacterium]
MEKVKMFLKERWYAYVVPLVLVIGVFAVWGGAELYYQDRALPGTMLAGEDISGYTREQIRQKALVEYWRIKPTVQVGEVKVGTNAREVGIKPDLELTVENAIAAGRSANVIDRFNPGVEQAVELELKTDIYKTRSFIEATFPDAVKPIAQAQAVYDPASGMFLAQEGKTGENVSAGSLDKFVKNMKRYPGATIYEPYMQVVEPEVSPQGAQAAVDYANARLGVVINYLKDGAVAFTLSREQIATLFVFTPNMETDTLDVTVNGALAGDYVGAALNTPRLDRYVYPDENGEILAVFNEGHDGIIVTNTEELVAQTESALSELRNADLTVVMNVDPVQEVTDQSDHWIDLNLSTQTTTLMRGNVAVQSFLISSGVAGHRTPTGDFAVFYKTTIQSMRGGVGDDAYDIPNIKWNSFFVDECAFHTAYWHNNFGTPMSHGCVNMREADAYLVYLWAPIGTPVKSHY